jgi:hypothetical protein
MAEENYPQDPQKDVNVSGATTQQPTLPQAFGTFPTMPQRARIGDYEYFGRLFFGEHFAAFNIRVNDPNFSKEYAKLRYVKVNFPGFISKVCADMLFGEPPKFKSENNQEWLDAFVEDNHLHIQNYESSLSNSYNGDALYKLRIGLRNPGDKFSTVIVEDITPSIYFPRINQWNVRATPEAEELAWTFTVGDKKYLRKEIHFAGRIENEVWIMDGEKIVGKTDLSVLNDPTVVPLQYTGVSRSLLFHIPNWKAGNRYFGVSDYNDLDSLFFALNNRITKVDNILDKHSDPILALPEGILDEKGQVKKSALGVIEIKEGENNKPEYIVWDASLENAYKQIEKTAEFIMMIGEISPDVVGMGSGQSDSGRALKMKIMRTLAKIARKKMYYDMILKDMLYTAQELAKAWNVGVGKENIKLSGKPERPSIKWMDGLPIDESEQVDTEVRRIDGGLSTTKDSLMRIDGLDEKEAEEKAKEIQEEAKVSVVTQGMGKFFDSEGNPINKPVDAKDSEDKDKKTPPAK